MEVADVGSNPIYLAKSYIRATVMLCKTRRLGYLKPFFNLWPLPLLALACPQSQIRGAGTRGGCSSLSLMSSPRLVPR